MRTKLPGTELEASWAFSSLINDSLIAVFVFCLIAYPSPFDWQGEKKCTMLMGILRVMLRKFDLCVYWGLTISTCNTCITHRT